jgi:hypothetical protein
MEASNELQTVFLSFTFFQAYVTGIQIALQEGSQYRILSYQNP